MSHRRTALVVIVAAAVLDAGCGIAFAAVQHIPAWLGLYCALANAVTVGGTVPPSAPAGYAVTAAECALIVPLFAATFSLFTSGLTAVHFRAPLTEARAARRIAADLHKALTGTEHPDAPERPATED